jgi:hypothetical protein
MKVGSSMSGKNEHNLSPPSINAAKRLNIYLRVTGVNSPSLSDFIKNKTYRNIDPRIPDKNQVLIPQGKRSPAITPPKKDKVNQIIGMNIPHRLS